MSKRLWSISPLELKSHPEFDHSQYSPFAVNKLNKLSHNIEWVGPIILHLLIRQNIRTLTSNNKQNLRLSWLTANCNQTLRGKKILCANKHMNVKHASLYVYLVLFCILLYWIKFLQFMGFDKQKSWVVAHKNLISSFKINLQNMYIMYSNILQEESIVKNIYLCTHFRQSFVFLWKYPKLYNVCIHLVLLSVVSWV